MCIGGTVDRIGTLACVMVKIKPIYDEFGCTIDLTRAPNKCDAKDAICLLCVEFLRY